MIESIIEYFKSQMLTNEFFSGAAIVTILGTLFYQLKSIPEKIWRRIKRKLIYTVRVYQSTELFDALEFYFYKYYQSKYRNVEAFLDNETLYDKNSVTIGEEASLGDDRDTKPPNISFSHFEDFFITWKGWLPVTVTKGREKLENASDLKNVFLVSFSFSTLFGKKLVNNMLEEAKESYFLYKKKKKEVYVYVNGYSSWDKIKTIERSVDTIVLKKGIKQKVLSDLRYFMSRISRYKALNIPYKRGYLFYGHPGNGKTSFSLAIANHLRKNICYMNLLSINGDNELQQLFNNIPSNSILVMEDIDSSFDGRKPMGKITFSGLLNCIDGFFYKNGLITIITTNHINNLDSALIRSGRIDLKIELSNPDKSQVEEYLKFFYDKKVSFTNGYSPDKSMSDVMEVCLQSNDPAKAVALLE